MNETDTTLMASEPNSKTILLLGDFTGEHTRARNINI